MALTFVDTIAWARRMYSTLICAFVFLQVGLAKLNASGGATKGVMGQDLVIGMGDPIQTGDSIEVKYTGWLYQNKSFGNVSATSDGRVFFFFVFFSTKILCAVFLVFSSYLAF